MTADVREVPFLILLEFERERLRLCRDALQQSRLPQVARAWAALVHDGERRVQQLTAACRDHGLEPRERSGSPQAAPLAAALVGDLRRALRDDDVPPPRLASSTTGSDDWELRVG